MRGFVSIESRKEILDASVLDEKEVYPRKFWCKDPLSLNENCCFWHKIFYPNGGPERNGIHHPVYEYEQVLLDHLKKADTDLSKRLMVVCKSTGLGITEFYLLWIIWKCLTDEWFQTREAMIITGPNQDLAKGLIFRTKKFCDKGNIDYVDKGAYELEINGCYIKAYPSNNIDAARGKPRVSVFFGDEAAFFSRQADDTKVQMVGERYMAKGGAYTIWVSTPDRNIDCFMYKIMKNPGKYSVFEFYDNWGLKKDPITKTSIYSKREIAVAKELPSYPMEYQGQWGVGTGDIYNQDALNICSADDYQIEPDNWTFKRWGFIDSGFGSSAFGLIIFQQIGNVPHVIYAKDYERESATGMIKEIGRLAELYHVRNWGSDAVNPEIIKSMRDDLHLTVTGFAFNKYGKMMTQYASEQVGKTKVRIHPQFERLIIQLQTIKYKKNGQPDKNRSNPYDLGDCFQGGLWMNKMGGGYMSIIPQ